jgi:hypothetical protein
LVTSSPWLRKKHPRLTWKQINRRYTSDGTFQAKGVALFNPGSISVTRCRYRGARIPDPPGSAGVSRGQLRAAVLHPPLPARDVQPIRHGLLPLVGAALIVVPLYYLSKPGQGAPYSWYPFAALAILILSIGYAVFLTRRDPGIAERVGSIVADE